MGFYDIDTDDGRPFGFRVYRPVADRYDLDEPLDIPNDCWAIGLPHQCDDWAIAMNADREVVLAEARRFRVELDGRIAELEAG